MVELAEFFQKHYELYQQPESWFRKAVKLRNAASRLYAGHETELLKFDAAVRKARAEIDSSGERQATIECDEPDLMPVYLLHGYALENVLKAVLVHRNPGLIGANKLSKTIKSHNLSELASSANIDASSDEQAILRWLEQVTVWKGRYEAPKAKDDLAAFWVHDYDVPSRRIRYNQLIDDIFGRASALLPEKVTKPLEGNGLLVIVS